MIEIKILVREEAWLKTRKRVELPSLDLEERAMRVLANLDYEDLIIKKAEEKRE